MNEVMLSGLGILLALCGMTVLIFRRVSPIIVGPLAALLVTVMSGLPVLDSMPWNGSIVSVFGICHTTHKASYKYNFVTCAVIPVLCTFLIALPICIWLG